MKIENLREVIKPRMTGRGVQREPRSARRDSNARLTVFIDGAKETVKAVLDKWREKRTCWPIWWEKTADRIESATSKRGTASGPTTGG